jgi:serine/threonine-protein kinase
MFRHPEPGDVVGDYRLLEKLGDGSFGLVFKAERAGRFFAVKFLHDVTLSVRARREVAILAEMEHPCVVRFHGFDRWPVPIIGTPYIVMDLVDGLTLEAHATAHNPSARKAARFIFQTGLTLGEVHQRGVFHRDLKPTNIVIKDKGEVPVLIDFGVGWHVGAPVATDEGSQPGTLEFRAPESFQQVGRYECRPSDELWALGVCFYWLLTDILPFGDRSDDGFVDRVLHLKPISPHVLNPRVPEVLSAACMKMLEKRPGDRYGTVVEFCAALDKALSEAEPDASWDLPLFAPDASSNEEFPAWLDESDSMRWIRRWVRESPRRGWEPAQEIDAAAVGQGEQDGRPEVQKDAAARDPAAAAELVAPAVLTPAAAPVAAAPPAQPSRPQQCAPVRRFGPVGPVGPLDLLKRPVLALVAGIAAVYLVVGAVGLSRRPAPSSVGTAAFIVADMASPPPVVSAREDVTGQTGRVRELAQPGKSPEAGKGAAPVGALTPAPKSTAMPRNQKSRSKAAEKTAPVSQPEASGCFPVSQWLCTAAGVCSLVLTGCPGASPQVRPETAPMECPAGWQETHAKFGIRGRGSVALQGHEGVAGEEPATMKEGPLAAVVDLGWGELPRGTLLSGTLAFGENRYLGRFTQAQTPDRQTYPVCVQIYRDAPEVDCPMGVGFCPRPGSKPGAFKIQTRLQVYPTNRFE